MRGMVHGKLALGSQICGFFALSLPLLCASCGSAPSAFPITPEGTDDFGNDAPTLTFRDPTDNITVSQGEPFLIRWDDSDSDDNAQIDFSIVNTISGNQILLAEDIDENDTVGPDSLVIATSLIPTGTYNLQGVIRDGVNAAVTVFAPVAGSGGTSRLVVTIVRPGEGPTSVPPQVVVVQPQTNLAVSQDDTLRIVVQPTLFAPDATRPYDQDSPLTLYILLDVDTDPTNDDPADPDPDELIRLAVSVIAQDNFAPLTFEIPIDLNTVPPRPNGEPYYIRATAQDPTNPPVHRYASGSISVVRLAAGLVDLFDIGRVLAGARIYGFSPGANLGSKTASVADFDADGLPDFAMIAQFGNPRNVGPVGEGYLVYGRDGERLGGSISANAVSDSIPGVIFEAPPVRGGQVEGSSARTDGMTDISFVPDLTGDGRPELLVGLPHVHGAFESMDFDVEDIDLVDEDATLEIVVTVRQGEVTVQEGDDDVDITNPSYNGTDDTTLDTTQPTANLGSSGSISWRDAGPGQRKWALIKFRNILSQIPDDPANIDITSIDANLQLRIFDTGANGNVHQCLTSFNEATTLQTFVTGGGEPQAGVDYVATALAAANGAAAGPINVDVSEVVRLLIDGQLTSSGNELRFIIVPLVTNGGDETGARSSEFSIEDDRPHLEITYNRFTFEGANGCYPDFIPNNRADSTNTDPFDFQWTAGGIALMIASENRDRDPAINGAPRLDTTSVALEFVGMEFDILSKDGRTSSGNLFPRAEDPAEPGRIRGVRFMSGPFDNVDAFELNQPAREDQFGANVAAIGDLNNDTLAEILISAPRVPEYLDELAQTYGQDSTHFASTVYRGSIVMIPGADWTSDDFREEAGGTNSIPWLDHRFLAPFGQCTPPAIGRHMFHPADTLQVFPEDDFDQLGGASSAGDFQQDGIPDILCGAPLNDRAGSADTGAAYVLYGRQILGDFLLAEADDPILRAPMLRVRGVRRGDQIGWRQVSGLDVNGDRIDDVFISSPRADFRGVQRFSCAQDFDSNGSVDAGDLRLIDFNDCRTARNVELFSTDLCKAFDYDNDNDVDADDRCVFCCLSAECEPEAECVFGLNGADCCASLVDNGLAAVVFGGVFTDGDRDITQIATTDLPGVAFYGAAAGHRAGLDISSAGDFNKDGFGDILVVVPGEVRTDTAGRERVGVVYLIFGGTHLYNTVWSLASVGSVDLPGMVFLSPYVRGRPNEASPRTVAFIGDINNDGFGDIAIGNPRADFIDQSFPQGPDATDAELGRRRDAGDVYIVYGNNFGSNRGTRP